ncbi:MAG: alpha/beta hydrolase [Oceanicaulis sp.]
MRSFTILLSVATLSACASAEVENAESGAAQPSPSADPWVYTVNHNNADQWYLPVPVEGAEPSLDASLFVHEFGEGPTAVVVHGGWGAEHSYLRPFLDPLSPELHLVYYDQRGSLRSPCEDPCEISIDNHIADLERLRQALGEDQLTLIAHSMGTWLAQAYAQAHPDRVEKLVLVGALPAQSPPPEDLPELEGEAMNAQAMTERPSVVAVREAEGLTEGELTGRQISDAWKTRFAAVNLHDPTHWRRVEGGQSLYDGEAGRAATSTGWTGRWDYTDTLSTLPQPVDVIMGRFDFADFEARNWRHLADQPGSNVRFHDMGQTGHTGWYEAPVAYREAVRNALGLGAD